MQFDSPLRELIQDQSIKRRKRLGFSRSFRGVTAPVLRVLIRLRIILALIIGENLLISTKKCMKYVCYWCLLNIVSSVSVGFIQPVALLQIFKW